MFRLLILVAMAISSQLAADEATYVALAPKIDGFANDSAWQSNTTWYAMDKHILGELPSGQDFSASYTLRWDRQHLYVLVKLQDDVLFDAHPDPRQNYWDDDCLEVFIDEDGSGGEHLYNFNAFAYHVALDNQVVDIGPKGQALVLNGHIDSAWKRQSTPPFDIIWELAIKVFPDSYSSQKQIQPVTLEAGKQLGFMLAYCDNDGSSEREHFLGSHTIKGRNGDKNLGYKDASVFDTLLLKGPVEQGQ